MKSTPSREASDVSEVAPAPDANPAVLLVVRPGRCAPRFRARLPGVATKRAATLRTHGGALVSEATDFGQGLALEPTLDALASSLLGHLETRLAARHLALWSRPSEGESLILLRSLGSPGARLATRAIPFHSASVGRLDVDPEGLAFQGASRYLAALLPWIGLALALHPPLAPGASPSITQRQGAIQTRARACAARWELAPRQHEALVILASGGANKDLANALGISLKGAEFHVTHLLRRAGVASRAELIALFWSMTGL